MNLLIIGPTIQTSGLGGVTIHVSRLRDFLDKQGIAYRFVDYRITPLRKIGQAIARSRTVHLHVSNPLALLLFVLWGRLTRTRVLFTLHRDIHRYQGWAQQALRLCLRMGHIPILINARSYKEGCSINPHCVLLPAFIPPYRDEKLDEATARLVDDVRHRGDTICSTNAYRLSYDQQGNDLYGIGFLIRAFAGRKGITLLVSDPSGTYARKWEESGEPLPPNVHFIAYPHCYFELLRRVDVFIRNTSTDGDSLSVKEALYLGCRVLCSDAVNRPEGVITFRFNDPLSFEPALQQALAKETSSPRPHDAAPDILRLYRQDSRPLAEHKL